jgi:hypothetical protein
MHELYVGSYNGSDFEDYLSPILLRHSVLDCDWCGHYSARVLHWLLQWWDCDEEWLAVGL